MPPGDSTEFLLHCTGFGTERKFSKRFSVYTSAGDIHYPFKGEFRSIPHATEVDKTDFRLKKKRNMRQGESYEFAFTVTNLTDSLTVISRFNAADFFKMDRSTRLIPPHESRKIAVRFIAPKRPKASAITALISGSYHEIISFKMLNQGFIETAIIKVDAYVK